MKKIIISLLLMLCVAGSFAQEAAFPTDEQGIRALHQEAFDNMASYEGFDSQKLTKDEFIFIMLAHYVLRYKEIFRNMKTNPTDRKFEPSCLVSLEELNNSGMAIPVCRDSGRKEKDFLLSSLMAEELNRMFADARSEGLELFIRSTYRSYDYQVYLKRIRGRKNIYVAKAGHSEHGLGTACDLSGKRRPYSANPECAWTALNSEKYGFVMSMPKGTKPYEPWHFRYIGKEGINLKNDYFYGDHRAMYEFIDLHFEDIENFVKTYYEIEKINRDKQMKELLKKQLEERNKQYMEESLKQINMQMRPFPAAGFE